MDTDNTNPDKCCGNQENEGPVLPRISGRSCRLVNKPGNILEGRA